MTIKQKILKHTKRFGEGLKDAGKLAWRTKPKLKGQLDPLKKLSKTKFVKLREVV